MKFLEEYIAKVNASTLPAPRKDMLTKHVQTRLDAYAKMKHAYDFEIKEARDKADQQRQRIGDRVAESQKHEEIKRKFQEVESLQHQAKFKEAEGVALQAKVLYPESVEVKALYEMAKMKRRADDNRKFKEGDEEFFLNGLNSAERQGPWVDTGDPLKINPERHCGRLDAVRRACSRPERTRTGYSKASSPTSYPMLEVREHAIARK